MLPNLFKQFLLMYILSCIICIFAGFTLRICLEYNTETFTLRYLLLRFIITSCVSFIAFYIYRDYKTKIVMSFELYLFMVGFFAVFLINLFDKTTQLGFRTYTKILLRRLLAYVDTDKQTKEK